jgi:hypothetical protein
MSEIRSRNLSQARSAYERGDAAQSKLAHSITSPSEGGHSTSYNDTSMAVQMGLYKQVARGTLLSLVLVSTLSPVLPWSSLALTITALATSGGLAMALLASMDHSIEAQVYDRERRREAWELTNYRKGEVDEIIELFESRGVSQDDATKVVNTMAKYDDFFVDLMMAEELMMVKPLPVETTPYRFVVEGVAFAGGVMLPVCGARLCQVVLGGTLTLWAWLIGAGIFCVALYLINATNQLKKGNTVACYGLFTLVVLAVNTTGLGYVFV